MKFFRKLFCNSNCEKQLQRINELEQTNIDLLKIADERYKEINTLKIKLSELEKKPSEKIQLVVDPNSDKIENLVSKYCLGIIGIIESGNFDYERFKKTGLRISENVQRLNQLAMNFKQFGKIDETIRIAIESWAKKESTPKSYREVFK